LLDDNVGQIFNGKRRKMGKMFDRKQDIHRFNKNFGPNIAGGIKWA